MHLKQKKKFKYDITPKAVLFRTERFRPSKCLGPSLVYEQTYEALCEE